MKTSVHKFQTAQQHIPLLDRDFDVIDQGGNLYMQTYRNGQISRENLPGWIG